MIFKRTIGHIGNIIICKMKNNALCILIFTVFGYNTDYVKLQLNENKTYTKNIPWFIRKKNDCFI